MNRQVVFFFASADYRTPHSNPFCIPEMENRVKKKRLKGGRKARKPFDDLQTTEISLFFLSSAFMTIFVHFSYFIIISFGFYSTLFVGSFFFVLPLSKSCLNATIQFIISYFMYSIDIELLVGLTCNLVMLQ